MTAVSLDRWLLESDKIFFNLLLDSKDFAAFLRIGKHFQKMMRAQNFGEKTGSKVRKPRLFTFHMGEPCIGHAISHFLVTRLPAIRKLYEATLTRRTLREATYRLSG